MTGNILLDLFISLVGISLLVGLAIWLFPSPSVLLDENQVFSYIQLEEPDFAPGDNLFSSDRRAALIASEDLQEFIIIDSRKGDLVHRRFLYSHVKLIFNQDVGLKVILGDITFPPIFFSGSEIEKWRDKLSTSKQ